MPARFRRRARRRKLVEDLEPDTALAGDDPDIVETRHHGRAVCRGELRGNCRAVFAPAVVEDDLGPFRAGPFDLHRRRVRRHDDGGRNAEAAGGDGDAAGVIA